MGVRPGYKLTEVGVIPEDWEVRITDDISQIRTGPFGTLLKANEYSDSNGVPLISVGEIDVGSIRVKENTPFIPEAVLRRLPQYILNVGDIVFGRKGSVDRSALVTEKEKGWFLGSDGMRVRPNQDCYPPYISYQFQNYKIQEWLRQNAIGTTMASLNQAILGRAQIPYAPLTEQRAIAIALSDMDALLDGLNRLISKKRAIKQATMQQLLTGKTRLPGFSGEWEVKRLGDTATLKARIGWQGMTTAEYLDSGNIYLVTGTEFDHGCIDWKNCHFIDEVRYKQDKNIQLKMHDVLVTKDGTIGKVALIFNLPLPATLNSGIFVIRPICESFHPEFLYYLLCSNVFEKFLSQLSAGSTINHLYQKDFVDFTYRVPPTLDEQAEIAAALSNMDAKIAALETRLTKTRALKQAMMQELLTGRVRLVKSSDQEATQEKTLAHKHKANIHFIRSVLAAEIIDRLHEQPTFGHVKFEKMMFLVESLCEVETGSTYLRKAAGPYDSRALRSIDSQLRAQEWFDARKEGARYQYVPMKNRGGHKQYFARYFPEIGDNFEKILGTFKTLKTEKCEIVATLLAAWSDLLRENGTVSDELIVHEVLNNWHESKQRISKDRWLKALGWMRGKGFVPRGA
jgi:type I restriction enzyme S subunit